MADCTVIRPPPDRSPIRTTLAREISSNPSSLRHLNKSNAVRNRNEKNLPAPHTTARHTRMEQNWGEPRTAPGDQIAASGGESAVAALGIPRVPTRKDNQAGAAIKEQTRRRSQKGKRGRGSERKKEKKKKPRLCHEFPPGVARKLGGFVGAGSCGDWGWNSRRRWCGLFPAGRRGGRRGDTVGGGGSRARGPKSGEENKDDGEVLFGPNPNLLLRERKRIGSIGLAR